jgi:hypothetical protein
MIRCWGCEAFSLASRVLELGGGDDMPCPAFLLIVRFAFRL